MRKIVTADSGVVLERRFIACILASAFLCALPPPPADSQVRSINFVGFFACFHRYVSCLWNRRPDWLNDRTLPSLSPSQRLLQCIPIKIVIAIIEKMDSARGTAGRGKRRALFFFLPSLPTTQQGLCGSESSLQDNQEFQ